MSINVLYFASLREQIGRPSNTLEFQEGMSVLDAWKQATGKEKLADELLIAVNQEYTSVDAMLQDGDELAFFPAVTGG